MYKQRKALNINKFATKMRKKPSPIERPVKAALTHFGVAFEHQRIIGNFIIDFYLPKYKTVIECDGYKYHQNKDREERRDRYLIGQGFKVLHIDGWACKNRQVLHGMIIDFLGLTRPDVQASTRDSALISCPT